MIESIGFGIDEVVDDDNIFPCIEKLDTGVGADVAGAAGNENCHDTYLHYRSSGFCFLFLV